MWPEAERIRCWFHKMKNVLEKVPEDQHELIKRLLQDVRDAPDHASGVKRVEELIENHQGELPSAMACLKEDLEATLAHLKLPSLHQKMIRTTNLCERSFVEERRRTKVIPRFFDEKGCLKLVFATLWRASQRWRGVRFTAMERQQLEAYLRIRRAAGVKVESWPHEHHQTAWRLQTIWDLTRAGRKMRRAGLHLARRIGYAAGDACGIRSRFAFHFAFHLFTF